MSMSFTAAMLLAGINFLIVGAAQAGQTSVTIQALFASETEAAIHAANLYNPVSVKEDREFMGIIFRQNIDGRTLYGYTVGAGKAGHDQVTVAIRLPAGAEKVAFWHTHGADHWTRQYFSATDTALADEWQLPFYLAAADGHLRVYRPGDKTLGWHRSRQLGLGTQAGASTGTVIKAVGTREPVRIRV